MKPVSVYYSARARKDLKKLGTHVAKRITTTVARYTECNPLQKAKALSGAFEGLYRYRVGDYRVLFEHDSEGEFVVITVIHIADRKDVYN